MDFEMSLKHGSNHDKHAPSQDVRGGNLYHKHDKNREAEDRSLLIKGRTDHSFDLDDFTKIEISDFIPPIIIKLWRLLTSVFSKRGIREVTHITYIELGVVAVVLGTFMAVYMVVFNIPATFASLAYATQLYIDGASRISHVSSSALTKANQAKAFLKEYNNGVVLGISGTLSEDELSIYNEDFSDSEQALDSNLGHSLGRVQEFVVKGLEMDTKSTTSIKHFPRVGTQMPTTVYIKNKEK